MTKSIYGIIKPKSSSTYFDFIENLVSRYQIGFKEILAKDLIGFPAGLKTPADYKSFKITDGEFALSAECLLSEFDFDNSIELSFPRSLEERKLYLARLVVDGLCAEDVEEMAIAITDMNNIEEIKTFSDKTKLNATLIADFNDYYPSDVLYKFTRGAI